MRTPSGLGLRVKENVFDGILAVKRTLSSNKRVYFRNTAPGNQLNCPTDLTAIGDFNECRTIAKQLQLYYVINRKGSNTIRRTFYCGSVKWRPRTLFFVLDKPILSTHLNTRPYF